jgi:hypothetical protein
VECACKGPSIEPLAGVLDDGSRCATVFSIKADVATAAMRLTVVKPGVHLYPLMLHTRATGDNGFNATFSRSTVLRREGKVVARWDDGLHGRVFGVAFEWASQQPASVASMELDATKQHAASVASMELDATKQHAAIDHKFTLSLRCEPNATSTTAGYSTTCPQDGDTIETTIYITSQTGSTTAHEPTAVRISTEVEAALSCENSVAWVDGDLKSVMVSGSLRLHVLALDADKLPICMHPAPALLDRPALAANKS